VGKSTFLHAWWCVFSILFINIVFRPCYLFLLWNVVLKCLAVCHITNIAASSPICLPHLLICTCLISSPLGCPPSSVVCWCLLRFFIFAICYISLWLHFGLFVYIFLSDCFFLYHFILAVYLVYEFLLYFTNALLWFEWNPTLTVEKKNC